MNEKFEGWKLALVLLIPLAIIGAAVFIAVAALNDDDGDQDVATSDEQQEVMTDSPTPTAIPQTQPVAAEPTSAPVPTAIPLPTAAPIAAPTADPAATAVPAATAAPAATTAPAPAATSAPAPAPSGPTSTPTPDPSILVVACTLDGGTPFPAEITAGVGEEIGPFFTAVSPPEAAATLSFKWDFGNNRIAESPQTGVVVYDATGLYTVTVTATDSITTTTTTTTCGNVQVGSAAGDVTVTCSSKPADSAVTFAQATPGDRMTVTVTWNPRDAGLRLQYDFVPFDGTPVKIIEDMLSGNGQTWFSPAQDAALDVLWTHLETGTRGRVLCPLYPDPNAVPTLVPTATAIPTGGSTP